MNPIKILVFAEFGWRNGGENSWLAVAMKLKHRISYKVACPVPSELSKHLEDSDIEVVDWKLHGPNGERKPQATIRAEMKKLILDESEIQLIHANSLSTSRLAGPVAAELNMPCLGYIRDIVKLSRQAVKDINLCSKVIAVSQATKKFHLEQGIQDERCDVIYNGVDLETFTPGHASNYVHRQLGLDTNIKLILCIGQIGMRKGTDTVIAAYQQIHAANKKTALLLVGMRNSQKQEAVDFEKSCLVYGDMTENVFWLGRRNDVASLMREASLLLHAARQEPLGRVLLEALAVGLPMVATSVGGTTEIIPKSNSDLLCEVDNPSEMSKKALQHLERRSSEIPKQLRAMAEKRFAAERCAERLAQKYSELIQSS